MKTIGLLMIAGENDVLAETLALQAPLVDCFYVLDGTVPGDESRAICESFLGCAGYMVDAELPRPPFTDDVRCGYRAALHERAAAEHGHDNWFLILHGDEVWTFDPADVIRMYPGADSFTFPLPFYFPRAGEPWRANLPAILQLRWHLGPGWREHRMFRGSARVSYDPAQRMQAQPNGLERTIDLELPIKHYLYRSPAAQAERAARHAITDFDPDNYRDAAAGRFYWTDDMIDAARTGPHASWLRHDDL